MMAMLGATRLVCLVILATSMVSMISGKLVGAHPDSGSVVPAETRPCVDCHAFEFMQRALQDLKKTAYNLDSRASITMSYAKLDQFRCSMDLCDSDSGARQQKGVHCARQRSNTWDRVEEACS